MSAALALAEAGFEVDLIESSGRLGGRASSFNSPRLGIPIDIGQHILLGCCTNLLDFYKRVGALDYIHFLDSITFANGGMRSELRSCSLPEPFHLVPSLLSLRQLGISDKLQAFRLLLRAIKPYTPAIKADQWLCKSGQSRQAIETFWGPILIGALNDSLDRVSARYAAMVIRQSMLINRDGLRMGIPAAPLSVLHDELPRKVLDRLGVRIHTGRKVTRIEHNGDKASYLMLDDGESVDADYFVAAVDPATAGEILPAGFGPDKNQQPEYSGIITLYLWFRDSLDIPSALCTSGKHFAWCFNKSQYGPFPTGMACGLALVASAARNLEGASLEEIRAIGTEEVGSALGHKLPSPDEWEVVKHWRATFSPSLAYDKVRPSQSTALKNLFLAGDWTNTGWPGTMESAVRSGYACAKKILEQEGMKCSVPVPDLPPKGLTRLMGAKKGSQATA